MEKIFWLKVVDMIRSVFTLAFVDKGLKQGNLATRSPTCQHGIGMHTLAWYPVLQIAQVSSSNGLCLHHCRASLAWLEQERAERHTLKLACISLNTCQACYSNGVPDWAARLHGHSAKYLPGRKLSLPTTQVQSRC
jgi:hypothetical protein